MYLSMHPCIYKRCGASGVMMGWGNESSRSVAQPRPPPMIETPGGGIGVGAGREGRRGSKGGVARRPALRMGWRGFGGEEEAGSLAWETGGTPSNSSRGFRLIRNRNTKMALPLSIFPACVRFCLPLIFAFVQLFPLSFLKGR